MDNIMLYIAGEHNSRLMNDIENKLNAFIEEIHRAGGKCWLQSKSNKEHYYELTEPVHLNFYQPMDVRDDTAFMVHVNKTTGIVEEKNA